MGMELRYSTATLTWSPLFFASVIFHQLMMWIDCSRMDSLHCAYTNEGETKMAGGGFGWSEGISALSLGVSIVALTWARTSASAARRANTIQLHVYQRELFKAFHDLHEGFNRRGRFIRDEDIAAFQEHAKTVYLYVSEGLGKSILDYYHLCREINIMEAGLDISKTDLRQMRSGGFTLEELREKDATIKSVNTQLNKLMKSGIEMGVPTFERLNDEIRIDKPHKTLWHHFKEQFNKPFDWGDEKELV